MRLISIYFAVATLGIGEMIYVTLLNWVSLTRGPMGISVFEPLSVFGFEFTTQLETYYLVAVITTLCVYAVHRLTHSYYGNAMRSVREDDQCAEAMGVNVTRVKIQVFAASTFFAGVAGAITTHTAGYISPDYFRFSESILILAMVVVGGLGSVPGAVVGALLLIILPEAARGLGDYRMFAVGMVMFLSILLLPKGLFGEISAVSLVRKHLGTAWRSGGQRVGWR
jgi:branched-chain amino acid transport system permease protein